MTCFDCVHSEVKRNRLMCNRTGNDVEDRSNVCSKFAGLDTKLCEDCEYFEFGMFSRWNDHGKCKLTGRARRNGDVACGSFY